MSAYSYGYPDSPGHRGVDTSIAAAEAIGSVTGRIQKQALQSIRESGLTGLTSEELAFGLGMERTTVQPRTTELKLLGLIRDSGTRRPNRNGKRAIVWVAGGAS
jgi:predicted transcriptional regulator